MQHNHIELLMRKGKKRSSKPTASTSRRLNVVVRSPPLYSRGGPKWRDNYPEGLEHPVAPNCLEPPPPSNNQSKCLEDCKDNKTLGNNLIEKETKISRNGSTFKSSDHLRQI